MPFWFGDFVPQAAISSARVTAFEPIPAVLAIAKENFESCGLSDVNLLPYALSNEEKSATFYVSNNNPMGSSLENRYEGTGDEIAPFVVQCQKLSTYLKEPLNYSNWT
jgi:FkbM family methyltransferase